MPVYNGVYSLDEGGTLEVTFCESRATSFFIRLQSGAASPDALLGKSGLLLSQLELVLDQDGYKEWRQARGSVAEGEFPVLRVVATYGQRGWGELVVDYGLSC